MARESKVVWLVRYVTALHEFHIDSTASIASGLTRQPRTGGSEHKPEFATVITGFYIVRSKTYVGRRHDPNPP